MSNEAGHVQITEFSKEVIPMINWQMEDLFCQYGVAMPYFMLDFDFPDYSQRPDWVSGYNFNLDWGEWGYWLPWFNELIGLLFDEAGLPRWQMPDFSPGSWDMFNSQISQLYEAAVGEFGKTDIGSGQQYFSFNEALWACKYQSTKAGTLQSISAYLGNTDSQAHNAKCAIYDSSLNLLSNGTTEEKELAVDFDGWKTFDFSTAPSVSALTNYWLVVAASSAKIQMNYDAGDTDQAADTSWGYNSFPDPLVPVFNYDWEISIYATYV